MRRSLAVPKLPGARDPASYASEPSLGRLQLIYSSSPTGLDQPAALLHFHSVKMPPKKASKPEKSEVPIQPVPEKRGYEFGGP